MKLASLDPRVKLAALLCLSCGALFSGRPAFILALLALTLLMLLAGGVPPARVWGQGRGMLGLIALIFLLQCVFTRTGAPLLSAGGVTLVTADGALNGALVALRLLVILLSALIVLTGEARDYLLALTQWRLPYELAFMVLVALRFIPLLRQEAADVLCAAQLRGMQIKKAPMGKKLRAYVSLALPITAGAIRRSEDTAAAMEARAFRSQPRRSYMRRLRMGRGDWVYLASFALIFSALIITLGGAA